jgi:hypothetical protein
MSNYRDRLDDQVTEREMRRLEMTYDRKTLERMPEYCGASEPRGRSPGSGHAACAECGDDCCDLCGFGGGR